MRQDSNDWSECKLIISIPIGRTREDTVSADHQENDLCLFNNQNERIGTQDDPRRSLSTHPIYNTEYRAGSNHCTREFFGLSLVWFDTSIPQESRSPSKEYVYSTGRRIPQISIKSVIFAFIDVVAAIRKVLTVVRSLGFSGWINLVI